MKIIRLLTGIMLLQCSVAFAKTDSRKTELPVDTLNIDEVIVSGVLPLDNNEILRFYRTASFSNIDDILARLGSVNMIKRGAYAMEPQMGGFSGGQINVTIDGMRMFGACTDKMDPVTSYVEPINLRQIELKPGTGGLETGTNIGGAMNFALVEPVTALATATLFDAGLGYESNAIGRNAHFAVEHRSRKWGWLLNSVYRKSENYTDGEGSEVAFSQYEKLNLSTGLKYAPNAVSSLKANFLVDMARNVGYPALPMDVSQADAFMGAFEYSRHAQADWQMKIYANHIKHVMDDSQRDSVYYLRDDVGAVRDTVLMRMDMPGRSTTWGAFVNYSRALSERSRLRLKLENYSNLSLAEMTMYMHYVNEAAEAPMYMQTWPKMLRNVTGLFGEFTTAISDRLLLDVNARLDLNIDHQQNDLAQKQFSVLNYTIPRSFTDFTKGIHAQLQYQGGARWRLQSSLGYADRLPTITERYGYYLYNAYDGYDYIGNPYLKTEKSIFGALDIGWSSRVFRIDLNQTYSMVYDYILGETDDELEQMNFYAQGLRVFKNRDRAQLYTASLLAVLTPIPKLTLFSSTNYNYGRLQSGEALPLIAPLKNVLALAYTSGKWSVQAEQIAATAQRRVNAAYGETETPGFVVYNLKGDYRWRVGETELQLSAGISNLLDRAYYEHLDWSRIYRPGRSFELGANFRF